jgi:hypothetical protein
MRRVSHDPNDAMDASRRDYFRQGELLQRALGVLLVVGLLAMWLLSQTQWWWLELLCVSLLLACGAGIFIVSAWLFTRQHPVISVFTDRLWLRGLRERVVMLRNVRDAQLVESRIAGFTRRSIELTLGNARDPDDDDTERLLIALDAVQADPAELLELIGRRAALVREQAVAR